MEAREEMSPDGGKAMSWEDAKSLISDVQELFACTDVCPRKTHDDVFLPPLADDVFPPCCQPTLRIWEPSRTS